MQQATDDVTSSTTDPRIFHSFIVSPTADIHTLRDDLLNKFEMLKGCVQVISTHPNLDDTSEILGISSMAWSATSVLEDAKDLFLIYDQRLRVLARSNGEAKHDGK